MNFNRLGEKTMQVLTAETKIKGPIVACAFFALVGCETPPSALEEDFGSSVRNTIALQTAQPGQETPALDGVKADASFRAYQKSVAKPESSRELIQINVGN